MKILSFWDEIYDHPVCFSGDLPATIMFQTQEYSEKSSEDVSRETEKKDV